MKWYSQSSCVAVVILCLVGTGLLSRPRTNLVTHDTPLDEVTISIQNIPRNKTLFCCGFDDQCSLWRGIFDEFLFGGRLMDSRQGQVGDVLLMIGLDGPCDVSQDDIRIHFEGKVLFVNTESRKGGNAEKQKLSTRFYKIGPSEEELSNNDKERTLPVYFGAIFWYTTTSPQHRAVFLDNHRPHSDRLDAVAFVASNCLPIRREAASQISALMEIHHGKCGFFSRNHALKRIPQLTGRGSYMHNYNIYSQYRYCLVMENTKTSGYITEKIILAYMGGCIPIYWGTHEVFDVFHKDSFIFYDIDNANDALKELSLLQSNKTMLEWKQRAPILANGNETIEKYFSFSKDLGNGQLRQRIRQLMGIVDAWQRNRK